MAIYALHKETKFGVGDTIRVHQRLFEGEKSRIQVFEGMALAIRGKDMGRSVVVRRIGAQGVGMEMIFPLSGPTIEKIEVKRSGVEGVRQAKLYYTRNKSKREIERIYSRAKVKNAVPKAKTMAKKEAPKKIKKASKSQKA